MPRTAFAAVNSSKAGTLLPTETNGDAVNFNEVPNAGNTIILVRNNHATNAYNFVLHVRKQIDGIEVPDRVISVAAQAQYVVGPFDRETYGDTLWIDVNAADIKLRAINVVIP